MARQLVVELVGESRKLTKSLNDAGNSTRTFSDKVSSAGTKMTAFVSVPIIAFLGSATKAAMDDEAAQATLAKTLENVTGATDKQVKSVETQLEKMTKVSTFADDELRPAFGRLVTSTRDTEEANRLLSTAMDISAATGKPLQTVVDALAKAHDGNSSALSRLGIQTKDTEGKTLEFEDIMKNANDTFGGSAANALDTTAGKSKALARDLGELKEKIGADLLPALEKMGGFLVDTLLPNLDKMSGDNGAVILLAAALAGPLVKAIGSVQVALTALAAHPALIAIAALATQIPRIRGEIEHLQETAGEKGFLPGVREFVFGDPSKSGTAAANLRSLGIPGFASGGVVPGVRGAPTPILAHGGETVIPAGGRSAAAAPIVVQLVLDGRVVTEVVHDGLLTKQRRGGTLGFEAA